MTEIRALTILNEAGDQTLVWTEDRDAEMEEIIRKKMAEGISFFVITPRFFGLLPPKKERLGKASDAKHHRAISIRDEDFARFCGLEGADVVKTPDEKVETVRRAKDAADVASNQSIGVKPLRGG